MTIEIPVFGAKFVAMNLRMAPLEAMLLNVIVESMFAYCDVDGNQHVLIDVVVDHKPDGSAVLDADQFVVAKGRQHVRKKQSRDGSYV